MLRHKDGSLFVEWSRTLLHAMPVDYFIELLNSSKLHFNSDTRWYSEKKLGAANQIDVGDTKADALEVQAPDRIHDFYGHCWFIADQIDSTMWSDNESHARQIIISTTFRSLHTSITGNNVFGGSVAYRKIRDVDMRSLSDFAAMFVKPVNYQPENEFRLLIENELSERPPEFVKVEVDLVELIHNLTIRDGLESDMLSKIMDSIADYGLTGKTQIYNRAQ